MELTLRFPETWPSRATHMDWEDAPAFAASRGSRLLTATDSFK